MSLAPGGRLQAPSHPYKLSVYRAEEGLGYSDRIHGANPAESPLVDALVPVTPDFGACHRTQPGFP